MWEVVQLGEICDVLDSLRKPITKKDRVEGDYPYYGATGIVDWVEDYIFDEKLVLVGEDGAKWGSGDTTAFIATGKYWVNNHAHVLRPKPELVIHEWISYYLTGIDLSEFVTGLTVPKLNQANLRTIPIPLPPLAEQQRIVAKLDAAFAEINEIEKNTETRLASAKAIFENSVKKYFLTENAHCEVKKLSEIANYFNGLTYSPKDVGETGTVVLRSSNIQNGRMDFSDIVRVNKTIKEKLFVQPTDILICSRNGSKALIGKSSLVGEQDEPMTFGTFMMIVRSEYNNYLQWFFKSKLFKEQIAQGENTAINQITRYMLDDVLLPVPDVTTQVAISNNLKAIDTEVRRLQFIYQNKINELHALKSAILLQELQSEAA